MTGTSEPEAARPRPAKSSRAADGSASVMVSPALHGAERSQYVPDDLSAERRSRLHEAAPAQ
ncbi:hypothetical protein DEJ48_02680 [Streptomyces venezuelae]|uniref:Uncharacterized protein n=1 Tax=Streptomyces venezuelae TaxID=54571 RepID=A0A5P2BQ51_STRVZ|nr:hypothetical protein [Streptomyces venezuelae]QES32453.1 hypothetical protein DEJ48_02680 [Streptomyces venezuelae]